MGLKPLAAQRFSFTIRLKEQLCELGRPFDHVGLHSIKSAHTWMLGVD